MKLATLCNRRFDDAIEEVRRSLEAQALLLVPKRLDELALGEPVKSRNLECAVGVDEDILDGAFEHGCRRTHRVMPVDVAIHEVVGEHERFDGRHPFAGDRQAAALRVVLDRFDQPVAVDALAEGDATEHGIAQQVIDLVRVERAAENIGEQDVALRYLAVFRLVVDDVGDAHRVDLEVSPQDAVHSALRILDDAPGALLVVLEKSEELLERV